MNRKKKVKQTLLKQAKRSKAKKATNSSKPRYISKAERAAMETAEQDSGTEPQVDTTPRQDAES